MPGEVILTHQAGKDYMPTTGGSQLAYLLIEAKPTEMMAQVRMPLNYALVLDHSGSMKGAKLKNVKEAIKRVIDHLEPTDYIAVVIFDDKEHVVIPSMQANDPDGMKGAIDQIESGGGTAMSKGMIQGMNELSRWNIPNAIKRMILLTDGVTYGDSKLCIQIAQDARARGIAIYPLGIGADWEEDLLDKIGDLSGGQPAEFIRNPDDAMSVFQQHVQSAVAVALRNTTLTVRLPQGVTPKKAVGVLPIIKDFGQEALSNRQIFIRLGDLEKETPQAVLLELLIDPRPAGVFRLAQAELSYDVPIANLIGEKVRDDIKVTFTSDAELATQVNPVVMNFAEKANAHRLVTRVLNEYKQTGKATTRLAPNVTRVLDEETQAALEQINQGQQISQADVKSIGNKTRKLTQRLDDLLPKP